MLSWGPHRCQWQLDLHHSLSLFQGTNGSQLWDTAFAVQAFLEVRYPPSLHNALTKDSIVVHPPLRGVSTAHPLVPLLC